MEPTRIQIGGVIVEDILNPTLAEVAEVFPHIEDRLKRIRRWSDHPMALTVHQHSKLVERLVSLSGADFADKVQQADVMRWAAFHDYHEGVTGGVVGPVKAMISRYTDILSHVEVAWDRMICRHLDMPYPSEVVRGMVYRYDKAAETLEWVHAMGQQPRHWNHPVPEHLARHGDHLIGWARRVA